MSEEVMLNKDDLGFEGMSGDTSTPMLLISQALSDVVQAGTVPVGHFYNSETGQDYGTEVKVVVCGFTKAWTEWKPNQGGFVGRYPVGSLKDVTGDNYSGMMHGENKVQETLLYVVILPEHKEDGYLIFSSSPGSMRYLKAWNTSLRFLKTPAGQQAAIYSGVWNLQLNKDQNKQGKTFYSPSLNGRCSAKHVGWTSKALYDEYVLPARQSLNSLVAMTQPAETPAIEADF